MLSFYHKHLGIGQYFKLYTTFMINLSFKDKNIKKVTIGKKKALGTNVIFLSSLSIPAIYVYVSIHILTNILKGKHCDDKTFALPWLLQYSSQWWKYGINLSAHQQINGYTIFSLPMYKEMINSWGNGYACYPDLIAIHDTHTSKYHTVHHELYNLCPFKIIKAIKRYYRSVVLNTKQLGAMLSFNT